MTPAQKASIKFALLAINKAIKGEHPATVEIVDLHIAAGKLSDVLEAEQAHQVAQQVAVSAECVLVPKTPTNEMTSAMADALEDPENERSSWDLAENMYQAMLAAAPQPPQGDKHACKMD